MSVVLSQLRSCLSLVGEIDTAFMSAVLSQVMSVLVGGNRHSLQVSCVVTGHVCMGETDTAFMSVVLSQVMSCLSGEIDTAFMSFVLSQVMS